VRKTYIFYTRGEVDFNLLSKEKLDGEFRFVDMGPGPWLQDQINSW
jgi:hypothetical protein